MQVSSTADAREVAIWKDGWLPTSETFIRDQLDSYVRWKPKRLGYYRLDGGLPVIPDIAPYGNGLIGKLARTLFGTTPFHAQYEAAIGDAKVIHAHFGQGGAHVRRLARSMGLPFLVTFHGQDASGLTGNGKARDFLYARELGALFEEASILIGVSRFVSAQLVEAGADARKVVTLYTGTKPTSPPPEAPRTNILFVGRLIEMKGVADLLLAMEKITRWNPNVKLDVVGDGPQREHLESLASRLGLKVRFFGWLNPDEVSRRMEAASVLCAPSHSTATNRGEGFGMVYAEAGMRGLPVVAYDSAGAKEAVENEASGLLVKERDIGALADAITFVLANQDIARALGHGGRVKAERDFNIVRQTAKLEQIYDQVAGLLT